MNMKYGYAGKILRVNLENGAFASEKITEDIMRKYLGGKGMLSLYFEREIGPEVEPLSKDNILYFFTGIMSGIPAAGTSRIIMGCKSPVTGGFGMAESGGFIATEKSQSIYI